MRCQSAILAAAALLLLSTCDGTSGVDIDPIWQVRYTVANQSSFDVTIRYGSYFFCCYTSPMPVRAGATKQFAHYEEFRGPPPDADWCFTCISVYRESDSLLVFQLAPVSNNQFRRIERRKYDEEYKLVLTDAKLSGHGIESRCGEIFGTVVDSVTAAPLDSYGVLVVEDPVREGSFMGMYTGASTEYSLVWFGDVPDGTIRFTRQGYRCRALQVSANSDSLGNLRYRLDATMSRFAAPEDSTRYDSCY